MPKRTDISKILIIGSGPIVIGQACEFDYSGAQACKALKEEGYTVVLVNSNPATIMTDPSIADQTYIEPLTPQFLKKIIELEKPDAVLPTLGGQTGLNLAMSLAEDGFLEAQGVEMIGATKDVIEKAEDRGLFKEAMEKIGLKNANSVTAHSLSDVYEASSTIGFPCVVRPAFTLGGAGGGIAYNLEDLLDIAALGLRLSTVSEVLIETSLIGWKEYELEVMRDRKDNCVIICSIENLDPMGVHTGDSITVAPAQTLTDRDYQVMRNAAFDIIREIGVETGGANVQFAVNPDNGDLIVIEMNPRVSRSSALASKATGFPIAKLAAKLSVGYTLDELQNDITQETLACFEPSLDYCVVKIPRFNFDKFPQTDAVLGTSMKAVGEVMALGRTFKEAMQKGLRSLETKRFGFGYDGKDFSHVEEEKLIYSLRTPGPERLFYVQHALHTGMSLAQLHDYTKIDPWFLTQLKQIVDMAGTVNADPESIRQAKRFGFSDKQLAHLLPDFETEQAVREYRKTNGIYPTYKLVDTCSAEFEAYTPYYYSTYEDEDESRLTDCKKVMVLGGGPNRIGQGIEFDYCCVHACFAAREAGFESIMVNSNPETVSTDFDTSDKLFFEPLTFEDVMNIYDKQKPEGVIVQFGGQTPLNLASQLEAAGVRILGTSSDSIDRAEDRDRFQELIEKLGLRQPQNGMAASKEKAIEIASKIGYPVIVRPSYVLGGASMEVVYDDAELSAYMVRSTDVSEDSPVLIDKFLEGAKEVDVDAVSDGKDCIVAGVMQHVEHAGVHSGDSYCALPPYSLRLEITEEIEDATKKIALELGVVGLMNIQFAVCQGHVYVLEVNPRGSRTVPFVSKATGIPWAKIATRVILGESLASIGVKAVVPEHSSVKGPVFPFNKFPDVDVILGPEMKSTGEVMGSDVNFGSAFIKAQLAAGQSIPNKGNVFLSVMNRDKPFISQIARELIDLGFTLVATSGTYTTLRDAGLPVQRTNKLAEGQPHVVDLIKNGDVQLIINTPNGKYPIKDEIVIRRTALQYNIPVITTIPGAEATVKALAEFLHNRVRVKSLQAYSENQALPV